MSSLVVKNGIVLTSNPERLLIRDGHVVIEDDIITYVGSDAREIPRGADRIDADGCVVSPGFINTHTHAAMTLLRNYANDVSLKDWLEKYIWPMESRLTKEHVYIGAKLACAEGVLNGVTTMHSMYIFEEGEIKAAMDSGVRMIASPGIFSWASEAGIRETRRLIQQYHDTADGRIRISLAPHAPYTVDPETFYRIRELSDEFNGKTRTPLFWHTHLAETRDEMEKIRESANRWKEQGIEIPAHALDAQGPIEYLDRLGVLVPEGERHSDIMGAHVVHPTPKDINLIQEHDIKVSHNPVSNLKLASGIAPIAEYLRRGIIVGLGTDGPTLTPMDLLRSAELAALLAKGVNHDPTLISAPEAFTMLTRWGARAVFWDDAIGMIKEGMKADLVVIDFKKPHLTPMFDPFAHLIYSARGHDVRDVVINGKVIVKNRSFLPFRINDVMNEVRHVVEELKSKE